ncbi:hypothetical protein AB1E18_019658 [Capra hircus]
MYQPGGCDGWTQEEHVIFVSGKPEVINPPQTPPHIPQVLLDLCLKEDTQNQTLSYLLKKAKQEEPASPELPEAEDLHQAHAEHQEDPEGGAAGLCRGLGGELHLESGHFGQELYLNSISFRDSRLHQVLR